MAKASRQVQCGLASVSVLAAWAGMAVWAAGSRSDLGLSHGCWLAFAAACVGAAWVGLVTRVGRAALAPRGRTRTLDAFLAGARRLWPVALPLCLLSVRLNAAIESTAVAPLLLLLVALLVLALRRAAMPARGHAPRGHALIFSRARDATSVGSFDAWRIGLLLATLLVGCLYLIVAWRATGSADNDAAYYFGVARHIVRTGRLEEPIVWQFLRPDVPLPHRPFDYWQGLTSVILLPALSTFGATYRPALVTMGALSATSLILFWALVSRALAPRYALSQLVALLAYAFSPAMAIYRFDTESVVPFQIIVITALWAWSNRRPCLTALLAGALLLARADGAVPCAVFWVAAWVQGSAQRRTAVVGATIGLVVTGYVALNWGLHGVGVPPASRLTPFLSGYVDLYTFIPTPRDTSILGWMTKRSFDQFCDRAWVAFDTLRSAGLVAHQGVWFGLLMVPAALPRRRGTKGQGLCWALLFGGAAVVSWASPIVFAAWRSLHGLLPVLVLAGMFGLDELLGAAERWCATQCGPRAFFWRGVVIAGLSFAVLVPILANTRAYGDRPAGPKPLQEALSTLDATLAGEPVATVRPWYVIASTASPAISIPADGEAAMEAAFIRYSIKWLVLSDEACMGASADVCAKIRSGAMTTLKGLELRRVADEGPVVLFRVEAPSAS